MKETKLQTMNALIKLYGNAQQDYDFSISEIKNEVRKIGVSWTTFRFIMLRHAFFQKDRGNQ